MADDHPTSQGKGMYPIRVKDPDVLWSHDRDLLFFIFFIYYFNELHVYHLSSYSDMVFAVISLSLNSPKSPRHGSREMQPLLMKS